MHMDLFPTSLRGRLMVLLLLSLGPAIVITGYFAVQHEENAARYQRHEILNLAQLIAAKQDGAVQAAHDVLAALAENDQIQRLNVAGCSRLLQAMQPHYQGYVGLIFADMRGEIRCSARPFRPPIFVDDRTYFREAVRRRTFVVGEYQIGRISGKSSLPVAHPVFDRRGELRGVVMAALDSGELLSLSSSLDLPANTEILTLDRNASVVTANAASNLKPGRNIADTPLGRHVLGQHTGVVVLPDVDGAHQHVYGFARTQLGGTYIVVGYNASEIAASAYRIFRRNIAGLLAVWLVMLSIVWVGTHYIAIKPIHALNRVATALGRGRLDARSKLGIAAASEFSHLADAFDTMATSLEQREADIRDTESRMTEILNIAVDGIIAVDRTQRIILFNRGAEQMFGYNAQETIGQPLEMLIPAGSHLQHRDAVDLFAAGPECARRMGDRREVLGRRKDGSEFPVDISISKSMHKGEAIMTAIVRDVTERKEAENNMIRMALHDALTGLPNRVLFRERLEQAMAQAAASDRLVALLFLDVDRFKIVNDSLGHSVGDMLLAQVADRLKECVRRGDTVARLGGDEFTLICADVAQIGDIEVLARKALDAVARPYQINGNEVFITASLGITVFPFDDRAIDALVSNADTAMYSAKEHGGNGYRFFDPAMNEKIMGRVAFEAQLRRALERNEFFLEYQPQIDARDGRIVGLEALLRWRNGDKVVPPDQFIPIAEDTGMIVPIGRWVLNEACRQAQAWHRQASNRPTVAVNISGRQFEQTDFVSQVQQALARSGLEAKYLELEFTESIVMANTEFSLAKLFSLRALGVHLALDDFGTGYSSLSYLKRFPITKLKIDQSFVADVPEDADDCAIISAIGALAHNLGLVLIAEGVETAEQRTFLRANGCHLMQGYYYSRPLSVEKLSSMLDNKWDPKR